MTQRTQGEISSGARCASHIALVLVAGCSVPDIRFVGPEGPGDAAAALTAATDTYDFGTVVVGTESSPASFAFTNTGTATTGELGDAALSGAGAVLFALGTDNCAHHVLAPGDHCIVSVRLAPSSTGTNGATLTVGGMPGGSATVMLQGTVVEPGALVIAPAMTSFGGVAPGAVSRDVTFTATNTGGASTGLVTTALSGSDAAQFAIAADSCTGATLAAGATCSIKVRFAPTAPGGRAASLTATSAAAGTAVATLGGMGLAPPSIAVIPASADFGSVVTGGTSASLAFTFTNTGQQASGTLALVLTGADATSYQIASDACSGTQLAPAASCGAQVVFVPSAATALAASLVATASPGGSAASMLTGTGIPPAALAFAPASHDYGNQDVSTTSAPVAYMLTNTGGQPTSAISIALTNTTDFTIASDGCAGQALPPGASCAVGVTFDPATFGSKSATLQAQAGVGGTTAASLGGVGRDKLTLTVLTAGMGTGHVTANPGTLVCNGTTCFAQYYRGTPVALTATPDANMVFSGWSGACSGTGICNVTLDANLTVTATFQPGTQDLTITTPSGTNGSVAMSPTGSSCGTSCFRFATGTSVTLTAVPSAATGYYFSSWGGDCVGNGATCIVTMNAPHSVTATFAPANRVFVTSGKFVPSPNNTVAWADSTCQAAAAAANLPGTYIGWIDAGAQTFATRLGNASGWVRLDGKVFSPTKADLLAKHVLYPNRIDEHGNVLPSNTLVNSGLAGYNCMGWTVASPTVYQVPGIVGGGWTQAATYDWGDAPACGTPLSLYCFGIDYSVTVTYTKASGRFAFIGLNAPNTGGGVAALDNFCQTKAASAGLPGMYRAMVATTTGSAASRFSTAGAPWVRPDGMPLVATASDLFDPTIGLNLMSALELDEHGTPQFAMMHTGAPDLNSVGTAAQTCNNFTDNTSTTNTRLVGYASFTNTWMFGQALGQCQYGESVYCLQQ